MSAKRLLDLPADVLFYLVKNFLDVDDSLALEEACDGRFQCCFESCLRPDPNLKALGIRNIIWPEELNHLDCQDELKLLTARYELHQAWNCSDREHHPKVFVNTNISFLRKTNELYLAKVLRLFENLESLDLRGVRITKSLLSTILQHCKKLVCLKLNFSMMNVNALPLMVSFVAPKLIHLSCDNFSVCGLCNFLLRRLSRRQFCLSNLRELEFVVFPHKEVELVDLSELRSLVFCSFHVYHSSSMKIKSYILPESLETLSPRLQYLKIKSNCKLHNVDLMKLVRYFTNLVALNVCCNVQGYLGLHTLPGERHNAHGLVARPLLPMLESLTFDLYDTKSANKMLQFFIDRPLNAQRLKVVRLMSFTLTMALLDTIASRLKDHLTTLELLDVKLVHVTKAFTTFRSFSCLAKLRIEFTFQNDYPRIIDIDDYRYLRKYFAIPRAHFKESVEAMRDLIRHSDSIKEFVIIHWPNVKCYHFANVKSVVAQKNIKLFVLQC